MPLHLDALTEKETSAIFAWILQNDFQNVDDAFTTKKEGETFALASRSFYDSKSGDEVGKYVFTLYIDAEKQCANVLDVDIVLKNDLPVMLTFDQKLPQSSDSNEYYEVITEELAQHLVVETVNRYTVTSEIEKTKQAVFVSAFPFQLTIFRSVEAYNKFCGYEKSIQVGNTGIEVHGLSTTFTCPGNMLHHEQDADAAPWSFIAGEIKSFREITLSFGAIKHDAYIVTLHSALGELPTLVGKEMFDTSEIGVGKIVGMNAYIKANFVKNQYLK